MKKTLISLLAATFIFSMAGCSKKEEHKITEDNKETSKIESKSERPYLVSKYFDFKKGTSFQEISKLIDKDTIKLTDPGEFEADAGYKKREVSFVDDKNKLTLTFRDNKLSSKTFTYDSDDTKSAWFYSNYYDILDNDSSAKEEHGIWKNAIKNISCIDEYHMQIEIHDNIENN